MERRFPMYSVALVGLIIGMVLLVVVPRSDGDPWQMQRSDMSSFSIMRQPG